MHLRWCSHASIGRRHCQRCRSALCQCSAYTLPWLVAPLDTRLRLPAPAIQAPRRLALRRSHAHRVCRRTRRRGRVSLRFNECMMGRVVARCGLGWLHATTQQVGWERVYQGILAALPLVPPDILIRNAAHQMFPSHHTALSFSLPGSSPVACAAQSKHMALNKAHGLEQGQCSTEAQCVVGGAQGLTAQSSGTR